MKSPDSRENTAAGPPARVDQEERIVLGPSDDPDVPGVSKRLRGPGVQSHGIPWRRWNKALHRDLGYFCVALTLVYAISGVAVNHIEDWNPNYEIEKIKHTFEPVEIGARDQMVHDILQRLDLPQNYVDVFRRDPQTVEIFFEDFTVTANASEGWAIWEQPRERGGLYEMNFLHLNYGKGFWTWFADLFALGLSLLAITGLFMMKGKKGFWGRGKWFVGAGLLIPVIYLLLAR